LECSTFDSQLINIDSGFSPVCEEFARKRNEWAVLKLSSVTSGRFLPNENKVLPSAVEPVPDYEVKKDDVLFTRKNTEDLIAACALVYDTPPRLLLPDTIFRFKLKDNCDVNAEFLWGLFSERKFRKTVQSLATGSAGSMPNISKDKLNGLRIPTPPLPLQEKFAAIVQKFERVRRQQREATRQAEHLFQTLLHRAFRGEL
jgi:type I restriction enzyme S subunit